MSQFSNLNKVTLGPSLLNNGAIAESITGTDQTLRDVDVDSLTASGSVVASDITCSSVTCTTLATSGGVDIDSATASTTTTTGALTVAGGAGIAGAVNVGDTVTAAGAISTSNATASTNTTTGALTVAGGAGIAGAVNAGGAISTTSTTSSSSTTTGALKIAGGAGIVENLNVGGDLTTRDASVRNLTVTGTTTGISASVPANISCTTVTTSGDIAVNSATASTSKTTGSLKVAGGLGVSGSIYSGPLVCTTFTALGGSTVFGNLNNTGFVSAGEPYSGSYGSFSPENATSTANGSLRSWGGLGVVMDAHIGGNIYLSGNIIGQPGQYISGFTNATVTNDISAANFISSGTADSSYAAETGAVQTLGGASIAKKLHVASTTTSTSSATGAITCAGGVGVGGNMILAGNLLMNTNSALGSAGVNALHSILFNGTTRIGLAIQSSAGAGSQMVEFLENGTRAGNIVIGSGPSINYNTSSDYRLKKEVSPITGAMDKVMKLKPVNFKWKSSNTPGIGFLAHELQEYAPECVTGIKDASTKVDVFDDKGIKTGTKEVPIYQGVDATHLVCTLVKAIQELKTEIDLLKQPSKAGIKRQKII